MSSDNIRLSTGCAPRLLTMAGASSGVTLWYIVRFALRVSTSGPAAHKPIQPTPFTLHLCSSPRDFTSTSRAFFTWSLREERQLAATHTCTACSKGASDSRCCSAISWSSSRFNADLHLSRPRAQGPDSGAWNWCRSAARYLATAATSADCGITGSDHLLIHFRI